MTGKTHIAAGVTTALLLGVDSIGLILVGVGAILPDIDHGGSKLGSKMPILSKALRHRGPTHSLFFALLCFLLNPLLGFGVCTHLILDFLNPKGEELLWPWGYNLRIPLFKIKTGAFFDNFLFVAFGLLSGIIVFKSLIATAKPYYSAPDIMQAWFNSLAYISNGFDHARDVLKNIFAFART